MKKKVSIDPGCITCGACEFIAPTVFQVTDICRVRPCADTASYAQEVKDAAQACPVQVIRVEDE